MNPGRPDLPALQARLRQPPRRERVTLWLNQTAIGSVESELLRPLAGTLGPAITLGQPSCADPADWHLCGSADAALQALAGALRDAGLTGRWRHEALAVRDGLGHRVGCIERAAVRPLGLATHGVHLVGWREPGQLWVQQRAHDKADDPGLWDTLVGGMVPDGESALSALARETREEAGLWLHSLQGLHYSGHLDVCCPSPEAAGAGHRVERLDWYSATVPGHLTPVNLDGEVAQFACLAPHEAALWIAQGRFTDDAAAILAQALQPAQA
jgi:hypothetical protein